MSEESKSWYRMTRPLFNSGFEDDEFGHTAKMVFRKCSIPLSGLMF